MKKKYFVINFVQQIILYSYGIKIYELIKLYTYIYKKN